LKRFLSIILILTVMLLCGCTPAPSGETTVPAGETTAPQETENSNALVKKDEPFKILAITSSFGLNTTEYLYDIATAEGHTDVIVARLYIGACTLKKHVAKANDNSPAYTYYKKEATGDWVIKEKVTMLEGLKDEDWDIIFLQNSAAESGQVETYQDYIPQLISHVKANISNPDAKFIWNMTWAYQADSMQDVFRDEFKADQMYMYQKIVDAVKEKVVPLDDISVIIPTGTAIQNMRTTYLGDNFTQDTYHLNAYGSVIAGCTLYAAITGGPLDGIELTKVNEFITLTDYAKKAICESVNAAIANPFTVTNSTHTGR